MSANSPKLKGHETSHIEEKIRRKQDCPRNVQLSALDTIKCSWRGEKKSGIVRIAVPFWNAIAREGKSEHIVRSNVRLFYFRWRNLLSYPPFRTPGSESGLTSVRVLFFSTLFLYTYVDRDMRIETIEQEIDLEVAVADLRNRTGLKSMSGKSRKIWR